MLVRLADHSFGVGGADQYDFGNQDTVPLRYYKLERSGTTATLKIYSDSKNIPAHLSV